MGLELLDALRIHDAVGGSPPWVLFYVLESAAVAGDDTGAKPSTMSLQVDTYRGKADAFRAVELFAASSSRAAARDAVTTLAVSSGTLLDLTTVTLGGWAELTAVMAAVLVMVDLAWVLAAAQARRLLHSPAARRLANRFSAGLMAGAAGAMAAR